MLAEDDLAAYSRIVEILILEDDPEVLKMLGIALQRAGFVVRTACSGYEAAAVYRDHHDSIAAVVLDIQLTGGLDGPTTLQILQRLNPAVACIFISGWTGHYTVERLLSLGARRVLLKPFALAELVDALHEIVMSQ